MSLPKSNLKEFLNKNKGYNILKRYKDTTIIKLPNGKLLKIISNTGYNLETRLNEVKNLNKFTNFSWPTMMLGDDGIIKAYVMSEIPGVDFTNYYENILNLTSYASIHSQIETNIKMEIM